MAPRPKLADRHEQARRSVGLADDRAFRSGAGRTGFGIPSVTVEEIADDGAHAPTLAGGTSDSTTVKLLGQTDGDPRRVDTDHFAERWPTAPGRPRADVEILLDPRRKAFDIGFRQPSSAPRDHRSCHRITSS